MYKGAVTRWVQNRRKIYTHTTNKDIFCCCCCWFFLRLLFLVKLAMLLPCQFNIKRKTKTKTKHSVLFEIIRHWVQCVFVRGTLTKSHKTYCRNHIDVCKSPRAINAWAKSIQTHFTDYKQIMEKLTMKYMDGILVWMDEWKNKQLENVNWWFWTKNGNKLYFRQR